MATDFPPAFVWGAATSAYQVEGGARDGGRGPSIWDEFSHRPGTIAGGDTGDVACDHYHRLAADLDLMGRLGLGAYRFSVAWPRVQPDGRGRPNQRGLDFYRELVDGLLDRGIAPYPTLYHWDLPLALEEAGGWPVRDTAHRFAEYAEIVHDALGDRVARWTTLNEPWVAAFMGYGSGTHAPGRTDPAAAVAAAHHMLLGHGEAVAAMRAEHAAITLNLTPVEAASDRDADTDAARRVDGLQNRLFLDAVLAGGYPEDVLGDLEAVSDLGFVEDGDAAVIGTPIDALGVNYYTTQVVRAGAGHRTAAGTAWPGSADVETIPPSGQVTEMGWKVDPDGLGRLFRRLAQRYPRTPLYVTENGAAFADEPDERGRVDDGERVEFLDRHLRVTHAAIEAGVDVRGYFVWSLMDNFEWAKGYRKRFGLCYVDGETLARTPKRSALWYRDVIARNGLSQ
jgi:beta-glucosidase